MSPDEVYARVWRTSHTRGWMQWMIDVKTPRVRSGPLGSARTEEGAQRKAERMVAKERAQVAKEAPNPIRKEFYVR